MASRLLDALADQRRTTTLRCPATGLDLEIRLPTRADQRTAAAYASRVWQQTRGKSEANKVDAIAQFHELSEYQSLVAESLLAQCVTVRGEADPIGHDAVDALDEETLTAYKEAFDELVAASDPSADTWTQADVDDFLDRLKKKDARTEDTLSALPASTLRYFVRTMAAR